MFDDNSPQGAAPKNLPVSEPDDMFSDMEKDTAAPRPAAAVSNSALGAGKLRPKSPEMPPPPSIKTRLESGASAMSNKIAEPPKNYSLSDRVSTLPRDEYKTKEPILGKVFIILIVVAAAIGLGYGAWLFYLDYTEDTAPPILQNKAPSTEEVMSGSASLENEEVVEETGVGESTTTTEEAGDDDEIIVVSRPVDDDGDSLSNAREEELGTNPMLADTDEDGLRDGDEVIIWSTNPLNPDSDGDGYLDGVEIENGYNPMGPGRLFVDEDEAGASI